MRLPRSGIIAPARYRRLACSTATVALTLALAACGKRAERIDLTEWVFIDPGPAVVRLAEPRGTLRVTVRNLREHPLRRLRLTVESPACETAVSPAELTLLAPGDRAIFQVDLARRAGLKEPRHPLELTLHAQELPVPAGVDLSVDLTQARDDGWIEVGQVKIVNRSGAKSVPYLLAALPLAVVAGWLLYRLARKRRAPPAS